ncbi:hypothetical protein HYR99_02510 [Candidatus Poribacteria bacterium]|nr:hypothetical protein [Candidatus Poribacteria bacterium]
MNLPPGAYLLRCQTSDGYVYYGEESEESEPQKLQISASQSMRGVNFRFASFKKGTWKNTPFDGLDNPNVRCIYRTPDGILWVGTHTGDIYRFDGSIFERLATKGEFIDSPPQDIDMTPDGALWFATEWNGLRRYDARTFRSFTMADGLPSNSVFSILADLEIKWALKIRPSNPKCDQLHDEGRTAG